MLCGGVAAYHKYGVCVCAMCAVLSALNTAHSTQYHTYGTLPHH